MNSRFFFIRVAILPVIITSFNSVDLSIVAEPYATSGLFTNPVIPVEKEVVTNAHRLFFDYYIKPCVMLMRESLWLEKKKGELWELTAVLSNISEMDSKEVTVKFLVDGRLVDNKTTPKVPSGSTRFHNRALLKQSVSLNRRLHDFEVRITAALGAAVIDSAMQRQRVVR